MEHTSVATNGLTIEAVEPACAAALCEPILRALPAWFGIEAALRSYVASLAQLRTHVARRDGAPVGFVAVRTHNASTVEIEVMGVLPAVHRLGVGRALLARVESDVRAHGHSLLEVKTLGPARADANYAQTRAFYTAMGFAPLEETTAIWGATNPCLILVKPLGAATHDSSALDRAIALGGASTVRAFYDALTADYHQLFADWPDAVRRQGAWLDRRLRSALGDRTLDVLDAACGIGTQALGLALHGHRVCATDQSPAAVARAQREAAALRVALDVRVADLRSLERDVAGAYDAVVVFDNALPHLLTASDLALAARSLRAKLRPAGVLCASVRDYDARDAEQARAATPRVLGEGADERVVFQRWDWDADGVTYGLRQFVLRRDAQGAWQTTEHSTRYRAWQRDELTDALTAAGFRDVAWTLPGEPDAFYQPVLLARG